MTTNDVYPVHEGGEPSVTRGQRDRVVEGGTTPVATRRRAHSMPVVPRLPFDRRLVLYQWMLSLFGVQSLVVCQGKDFG
jgi:hypothetical protein